MQGGSSLKLTTIAVVWLGAHAMDTAWTSWIPPSVEQSAVAQQLHATESVRVVDSAEPIRSSPMTLSFAVAAIVTTGILVDALMTRLSGGNHPQTCLSSSSVEVGERQER